MYIIFCVIDQTDHLSGVLAAWRESGASGITILESSGLHRLSKYNLVPMRYIFGDPDAERGNYTLFSVVENEATVQRCLQATEAIVGSFDGSNTGIFVAWPLSLVRGVMGQKAPASE